MIFHQTPLSDYLVTCWDVLVAVSRIISLRAALLIIHVLIDCRSTLFLLMFSDSELAMTLIDAGLMRLKCDSVEHVSSRQACVAFCYSVFQTFSSHTTTTIHVRVTVSRTKHLRIPLSTANINTCVQDNGLPGCFTAWQVCCLPTSETETLGKPKTSKLLRFQFNTIRQ